AKIARPNATHPVPAGIFFIRGPLTICPRIDLVYLSYVVFYNEFDTLIRVESTSLHERFAMVLRFSLSITLLILGLANEATLKAEPPAHACKSTGTGTLEMIPLDSKVFGNKRFLRVWLPPGYSK